MGAPQQALAGYGAYTPPSYTYATWNPSDKSANITLSGGDLIASASSTGWKSVRSTIGKSSGKRYWECVVTGYPGAWNSVVGVGTSSASLTSFCGSNAYGWSYYSYYGKSDPNNKYNNNVNGSYGAAYVSGDVIGVALDMDAGTITFYKNNTSQGQAYSGLSGTVYAMCSPLEATTTICTANFGATSLVYSPPSGFNAGLYS